MIPDTKRALRLKSPISRELDSGQVFDWGIIAEYPRNINRELYLYLPGLIRLAVEYGAVEYGVDGVRVAGTGIIDENDVYPVRWI